MEADQAEAEHLIVGAAACASHKVETISDYESYSHAMIVYVIFLGFVIPTLAIATRHVIKNNVRFIDYGPRKLDHDSLETTATDRIYGGLIVIVSMLVFMAGYYLFAVAVVNWFRLDDRPVLPVIVTEGIVTQAELVGWNLTIDYSYAVRGDEYSQSVTHDYFPSYYADDAAEQALQAHYSEGARVRVVYNPVNPIESRLVRPEVPGVRVTGRAIAGTLLAAVFLTFPAVCSTMPLSILIFGAAGLTKMR